MNTETPDGNVFPIEEALHIRKAKSELHVALQRQDWRGAVVALETLLRSKVAQAEPWPRLECPELLTEAQAPTYLSEPLALAPGPPTLVAGYSYSGKTLFAQEIALKTAAGLPCFGEFALGQQKVLHIDWDQGERLTRLRYARLARGAGVDPASLVGRLSFADSPLKLDDHGAVDVLRRELEGHGLCVMDSLSSSLGFIDDNDPKVGNVMRHTLKKASEDTGCTILLVHNYGKSRADPGSNKMERVRGHSSIFDVCQTIYALEKVKVGGERVAKVSLLKEKLQGRAGDEPAWLMGIEDVASDSGKLRWGVRVTQRDFDPDDEEEDVVPDKKRPKETEFRRALFALLRAGGKTLKQLVEEMASPHLFVKTSLRSAEKHGLVYREGDIWKLVDSPTPREL